MTIFDIIDHFFTPELNLKFEYNRNKKNIKAILIVLFCSFVKSGTLCHHNTVGSPFILERA